MQQLITIKEVKLFERIRKDCVDDLAKYLKKIESPDSDYEVIVKADPLLVWSFATLDAEKTVSYEISKFLDESCRRDLKATAAAEYIEDINTKTAITPIQEFPQRFNPENPNLLIENPDLSLVSREFENIEIKENEIKEVEGTGADLGFVFIDVPKIDLDSGDVEFDPTTCIKVGKHQVKCPKGIRLKDIKIKKRGTNILQRRHKFGEGGNEKPEVDFSGVEGMMVQQKTGVRSLFPVFGRDDLVIKNAFDNIVDGDWENLKQIFYKAPESITCETPKSATGKYEHDIICNIPNTVSLADPSKEIKVDIEYPDGKKASGEFEITVTP